MAWPRADSEVTDSEHAGTNAWQPWSRFGNLRMGRMGGLIVNFVRVEIRLAQSGDYARIVELQDANTAANLAADERDQGSIQSQMDLTQVSAINADLGIVVAVTDTREIVGFVCTVPADRRPRPAILDALVDTLSRQTRDGQPIRTDRTFIYGPICVAASQRGQ